MTNAKDVILMIEDVLIAHGSDVKWEISYDPSTKKYTVSVQNLSVNV